MDKHFQLVTATREEILSLRILHTIQLLSISQGKIYIKMKIS